MEAAPAGDRETGVREESAEASLSFEFGSSAARGFVVSSHACPHCSSVEKCLPFAASQLAFFLLLKCLDAAILSYK